jgi:hypothetical protein
MSAIDKNTTAQRLLLFFEHPLFWGPIGIVGGLVGLFFYTPILFVCGVCVLLAFHRVGVVSGKQTPTQVMAYILLSVITVLSLYGTRVLIKTHSPDIGKDIAKEVIKAESENKKETIKTPSHEPDTTAKAQQPNNLPAQRKPVPKDHPQRPYDLTGPRREKFLKLLGKTQAEPRDIIRIGCISWSDAACVAAGKFLILFSEAGWTIDSNRVFRLEPQIPIDGMAMASHVDNVDDAKKLSPHLGTWQRMDASQVTIWRAFKEMGIPVTSSGDISLPAGTLGIYFGPEPQLH